MSERFFFSVVIPALNEEKYLPNLLHDLAEQTCTDFEVIVVDGSSDDDTVKVAKEFDKKLSLTVHTVTKRNVSYQRNEGGKLARGEWIIFMDADNRLPTHFLDGVKYQIAKYNDFQVFTTWLDVDPTIAIDQPIAHFINFGMEAYFKILNKPSAFGALIGVTREVFKAHMFDEHQLIFEDSLFVQNISNAGFAFRVLHEPRFTFSFRRMKKEGTFKMIRTIAISQLKYLQGDTFEENNYGYHMSGGGYYDQQANPPFFHRIQEFIQTASERQLAQAKKIITSIKEFEL